MLKWNIRDLNDFVGTQVKNEDEPDGLCYKPFTYPETAAILKKIANIIPDKCCQKCNGLYQIN